MDKDPLIPEGVEPRTEPIKFEPVETLVPGLVMRRGVYEREDVSLVILAASHRDHERELDEVVLGDFKFWAHYFDASAEREPPDEPEDESFDLAEFIAELIEDQQLQMRHFGIQVAVPEETERGYVWLIDKAIEGHTIHWYVGGDEVSVSMNQGAVRFRRTGYRTLDVPPRREDKPAPNGCSIKAFQDANYNIVGAGRHLKTTPF